MDLRVDVGGGVSNLQLAGLSLTRLDVTLGAGQSTIDLTGNWARDLRVTIDAGAADLTVRLPKHVGVRVVTDPGAAMFESHGLNEDEGVYTNAAFGVSNVTLQLDVKAGIGRVKLEVEEAAALQDQCSGPRAPSQLVQAGVDEAGSSGCRAALVDVE